MDDTSDSEFGLWAMRCSKSSDNPIIAAASQGSNDVRVWDMATGEAIALLKGHVGRVGSIAFTPDGHGLVSCSRDTTLKHWDLTKITDKSSQEGSDEGCPCTMTLTGHGDLVWDVAVSHDARWIVSGSRDSEVLFWDLKTGDLQCRLQGHSESGE